MVHTMKLSFSLSYLSWTRSQKVFEIVSVVDDRRNFHCVLYVCPLDSDIAQNTEFDLSYFLDSHRAIRSKYIKPSRDQDNLPPDEVLLNTLLLSSASH